MLADRIANEIESANYKELTQLWERVWRGCVEVARSIGKNEQPSALPYLLDAYLPILDKLPCAGVSLAFYKDEDGNAVEVDEWDFADYAILSLEGISLRHKAGGKYETFSSTVADLIYGSLNNALYSDRNCDWDGDSAWFYLYK